MNWLIGPRDGENMRTKIWREILATQDMPVADPDGRGSYGLPEVYRREFWLDAAYGRMIGEALPLPEDDDDNKRGTWHSKIERRGLVDDFLTAVLDEAWPNDDLRGAFLDNCEGFLVPDPHGASALLLAAALDALTPEGFSGGDDGDKPPEPDKQMRQPLVILAAEVRAVAATARLAIAAEDVLSAVDMMAVEAGVAAPGNTVTAALAEVGTRIDALSAARAAVQAEIGSARDRIGPQKAAALAGLELAWTKIGPSVDAIIAAAPSLDDPDAVALRSRCRLLLERLTEAQHLALTDLRFRDLFDALKGFLRLIDDRADAWYFHLRALVVGLRRSILAQSLWQEVDTSLDLLDLKLSALAEPNPAIRHRLANETINDLLRLEAQLKWLGEARAEGAADLSHPSFKAILNELAALVKAGPGSAAAADNDLANRMEDHLADLNAALQLQNRTALRKVAAVLGGMERLAEALDGLTLRMVGW